MSDGPSFAGLYHSAQSVSDDTCLYLENFAYRVANSSHLDATTKAQVTTGFDYYLGLDGNTTAEEIAGEVCTADRSRFRLHAFCAGVGHSVRLADTDRLSMLHHWGDNHNPL